MAKQLRRERVAEHVRHELSEIIQHEMDDPRVGWVTLTRVEMSPDLNYAKVFVSIMGEEERRRETMTVLQRAAAFLRTTLGRRIQLRQTPELTFKLDHSLEHSQHIMDVLKSTVIPPREDDEEGP